MPSLALSWVSLDVYRETYTRHKLFSSGVLAMFCQILEMVPSTKRISVFPGVLTCPVNPLSCRSSPRHFERLSDHLTSNQANHCKNVDRLMRAATALMKSWPFCHAAVIYIVRSYHLNAISHYYTLLGQFVKADCLFIFHGQHQLVWRTDVSDCVFF